MKVNYVKCKLKVIKIEKLMYWFKQKMIWENTVESSQYYLLH